MWAKDRMSKAFKERMTQMAKALMEGPPSRSAEQRQENAELKAAMAESAKEARRAASAERRRRQAEGGEDEELRAALKESAASAERRRRAASVERRRRPASAERRGRQAEGGEDMEAVLAESAALERQRFSAAEEERRQLERALTASVDPSEGRNAGPPPPKTRRRSVTYIKNPFAREVMFLLGEPGKGVLNKRLTDFIDTLLGCILWSTSNLFTVVEKEITPVRGFSGPMIFHERIQDQDKHLTCTGMILDFEFHGQGLWHAVPYIKIGESWYIGDNEKGGLVRREYGMPTGSTRYFTSSQSVEGELKHAILFYAEDRLVSKSNGERPKKDYTGTPIFGQTSTTCNPDSLQTILMLADGFHAYFYTELYMPFVPGFDTKFLSGSEGSSERDVDAQLAHLNEFLSEFLFDKDTCTPAVKTFILSMFLRYYRIENTPEEELRGIEWGVNRTTGINYYRPPPVWRSAAASAEGAGP
jgi:hypothetical protein